MFFIWRCAFFELGFYCCINIIFFEYRSCLIVDCLILDNLSFFNVPPPKRNARRDMEELLI